MKKKVNYFRKFSEAHEKRQEESPPQNNPFEEKSSQSENYENIFQNFVEIFDQLKLKLEIKNIEIIYDLRDCSWSNFMGTESTLWIVGNKNNIMVEDATKLIETEQTVVFYAGNPIKNNTICLYFLTPDNKTDN